MAEWIFNKNGNPSLIFDYDCLRNFQGEVIAWINRENFYSLSGQHKGWFENGVFYDSRNKVIGFLADANGYLPSNIGLSGRPGLPGFSGRPGRPGFGGIPDRPGLGGWSEFTFDHYFN